MTKEHYARIVGHNLYLLREWRKLTPQQVAAQIGLAPTTLRRFESGNGLPDAWQMYVLAGLYNVAVEYLYADRVELPSHAPRFASHVYPGPMVLVPDALPIEDYERVWERKRS